MPCSGPPRSASAPVARCSCCCTGTARTRATCSALSPGLPLGPVVASLARPDRRGTRILVVHHGSRRARRRASSRRGRGRDRRARLARHDGVHLGRTARLLAGRRGRAAAAAARAGALRPTPSCSPGSSSMRRHPGDEALDALRPPVFWGRGTARPRHPGLERSSRRPTWLACPRDRCRREHLRGPRPQHRRTASCSDVKRLHRRAPVSSAMTDVLERFSPATREWFRGRSPRRRRRSSARGRRSRPARTPSSSRRPGRARRSRRSSGRSTGWHDAGAGEPRTDARALHLAAQGARRRRRAQPARPARRRHADGAAARDCPSPTSRSACDRATRRRRTAGCSLRTPPDILITTPESLYLMLTCAARETLARRRDGHHRRGARGRRDQARRAPRGVARAARRAAREAGAAHRALGDRAPARRGRAVPRRQRAGDDRRARRSPRSSTCASSCRSTT